LFKLEFKYYGNKGDVATKLVKTAAEGAAETAAQGKWRKCAGNGEDGGRCSGECALITAETGTYATEKLWRKKRKEGQKRRQ